MDRSSVRRISRPSAQTLAGVLAIVGAGLVSAGVILPWLSFFAGLQPITALGTPNGTLLFIGAAAGAILGLVTLLRGSRWARRGLTVMGTVLTAFSAYLVVGLVSIYHEVSADPLIVAQPGPGLAVVTVGALLVLGASLVGD